MGFGSAEQIRAARALRMTAKAGWAGSAVCALVIALSALGCEAYDEGLLELGSSERPDAASADAASARDATADGAPADDAALATVDGGECTLNPNPLDEVCPLVCPERCDGQDNDCDRRIDEDSDDSCIAEDAQTMCSLGTCRIVRCEGTFRDCDGAPATGCEVAEDDVAHCGRCGHACELQNAQPACQDGMCVVQACADGFADCDADGTSCETALVPGCSSCEQLGTDSDADGTPDCGDGCPDDVTRTSSCFAYAPKNFEPTDLSFGSAPHLILNCGQSVIDSSGEVSFENFCGATPQARVQEQSDGSELVVITLRSLSVSQDSSLRLVGTRPVLLAVAGDVQVDGAIDAGAKGEVPGAGGDVRCSRTGTPHGSGRPGGTDATPAQGSGGGGGGSYAGFVAAPSGGTCGALQTYAGRSTYQCTDLRNALSARTACQSIGGGWDLAQIRSFRENLLVSLTATPVTWLGGGDAASEGTWRWFEGSQTFWVGTSSGSARNDAYVNWHSGEPNNSGGNQDCLQHYGGGDQPGTWDDDGCALDKAYRCWGPLAMHAGNSGGFGDNTDAQGVPGQGNPRLLELNGVLLRGGCPGGAGGGAQGEAVGGPGGAGGGGLQISATGSFTVGATGSISAAGGGGGVRAGQGQGRETGGGGGGSGGTVLVQAATITVQGQLFANGGGGASGAAGDDDLQNAGDDAAASSTPALGGACTACDASFGNNNGGAGGVYGIGPGLNTSSSLAGAAGEHWRTTGMVVGHGAGGGGGGAGLVLLEVQ